MEIHEEIDDNGDREWNDATLRKGKSDYRNHQKLREIHGKDSLLGTPELNSPADILILDSSLLRCDKINVF